MKSSSLNGFTLIEMLVVIAIIGVLAAISIGVMTMAAPKALLTSVEGDLRGLETALGNYFADHNQYPNDNGNRNYGVAPLYYELKGTVFANNTFDTRSGKAAGSLTALQTATVFGREGFLNATENPLEKKDYYPSLKDKKSLAVPVNNTPVLLLVLPTEWHADMGTNAIPGSTVNTWYYNSSSPTNNPNSYDLWGQVRVRRDVKVISNWRQ